jgi:hypothetical protein
LRKFNKYKNEIIESIKSADKKSILIIEINEDVRENSIPINLNKCQFILISDPRRFTQLEKYLKKDDSKIEYQEDIEYKYDDLTEDSKLKLIECEVLFQKKLMDEGK